jgi:hypothetical protein
LLRPSPPPASSCCTESRMACTTHQHIRQLELLHLKSSHHAATGDAVCSVPQYVVQDILPLSQTPSCAVSVGSTNTTA